MTRAILVVFFGLQLATACTFKGKDEKASSNYFRQYGRCTELLNKGKYEKAEPACKTAAQVSETLPADCQSLRWVGYKQLGYSLMQQKKFDEAIAAYEREVQVAREMFKQEEAELGYALTDVAQAQRAAGHMEQAQASYEQGLAIMEKGLDRIRPDVLNQHLQNTKSVLLAYASLLRTQNKITEAEAAEARANAIVTGTNSKN